MKDPQTDVSKRDSVPHLLKVRDNFPKPRFFRYDRKEDYRWHWGSDHQKKTKTNHDFPEDCLLQSVITNHRGPTSDGIIPLSLTNVLLALNLTQKS